MQIESPICCLQAQEEQWKSFSRTIIYFVDDCYGVCVDQHVRNQGRVFPEEPPQGRLEHLIQTLHHPVCQSVILLHTLILLIIHVLKTKMNFLHSHIKHSYVDRIPQSHHPRWRHRRPAWIWWTHSQTRQKSECGDHF